MMRVNKNLRFTMADFLMMDHVTFENFPVFDAIFFFFFILNIKIYNNKLPITLPTKLLYDTTKTLPGGAIYRDYPLAFNIKLKRKRKYI